MFGSGVGRASGRARGRPSADAGDSPTSRSMRSSPDSVTGSPQGTNRGRGGFRPETLLTTRPAETTDAVGTSGTRVDLFANYFTVVTDTKLEVYDYRIDFEPEVESTKVRKQMVTMIGQQFPGAAGRPAYLYDGRHNLKAMVRLESEITEVTVTSPQSPPVETKITIKRGQVVDWGSHEMLRLYNTQMRTNLQQLKWLQIYRNFYDPENTVKLPQSKLHVMMGLATSINNHDVGILLACDSINKIVRTETVLDVMLQLRSRPGNFMENIRRELIGAIVMTTYNHRTYKVDDLDLTKNPDTTFDRRNRGTISFVAYYQQQHNIQIMDRLQPLIVCFPSARDRRFADERGETATTHLLIPELCVMTGLSESLRSNFDLKKQLTQKTQLPPPDRYNALTKFRAQLAGNEAVQTGLRDWGVTYGTSLITVPGRVMEKQTLLMSGVRKPIPDPGDFGRLLHNTKMLAARGWNHWIVVHAPRDAACVASFLQKLRTVSTGLGLCLSPPVTAQLLDDRTVSYLARLTEWMSGRDVTNGLAVCVLPSNNSERYSAIKKKCFTETPAVASQCILSKTLSKEQQLMSVTTKICLQMAVKLESQPWSVDIPTKNVMIVGYDTYHDGTRKGQSAGAFIASMDTSFGRYYSHVTYHSNKDEMSSNIAFSFRMALVRYEQANGTLPGRVFMYRDGVGDGMLRHVYQVEVNDLKKVIEEVSGARPDGQIKLMFTVVTKRLSTKFLLKNIQQKLLENPVPGTVIDSVVTRPERLEFYLVSQSVRHGTVGPTNYNVICNTTSLKVELIQMLTYKLCHLYFNWPGTIRVPAPCQYAHKLAFMTGSYLHREPQDQLSERLFYL